MSVRSSNQVDRVYDAIVLPMWCTNEANRNPFGSHLDKSLADGFDLDHR